MLNKVQCNATCSCILDESSVNQPCRIILFNNSTTQQYNTRTIPQKTLKITYYEKGHDILNFTS